MRDLFQQDRAVSQSSVRMGVMAVGGLFAMSAAVVIVQAVLGIFGISAGGTLARLFAALLQIGLGLGALLALYMVVRLLSEILMAQHRLNDRMSVLSDELGSIRDTSAKPVTKKRITKRASTTKSKDADTGDKPDATK